MTRPTGQGSRQVPAINKVSNEYAEELGSLYDRIPKAVLAAIAVSYASNGGYDMEHAVDNILAEWQCLHNNHIIPQKPVQQPREG